MKGELGHFVAVGIPCSDVGAAPCPWMNLHKRVDKSERKGGLV